MTKRISLTIAALALAGGLLVSAALANGHRNPPGPPNPRAGGAPGAHWSACAQHPRGSEAFRKCVRQAARNRSAGRPGPAASVARACAQQHPRGSQAFRSCVRAQLLQRSGIARACSQHQPGSQAFRNCVRAKIQRRKAAFRQCRQQHRANPQALRQCLRAAKQP